MIPIVETQEIKAKTAILRRVSNLFAITKLMILARISATAVEVDIKNKLPGIVSK